MQDQFSDMPNEVVSSSDFSPVNINDVHERHMTFGDKLADRIARGIGSWTFIIVQAIILVLWFLLNTTAWIYHWDGYPFVLCNLFMSAEAAFSAPIILMSQNRQSRKDRLTATRDYLVDQKSEQDILKILVHLDEQDHLLGQQNVLIEQKIDLLLIAISKASKTTTPKARSKIQ